MLQVSNYEMYTNDTLDVKAKIKKILLKIRHATIHIAVQGHKFDIIAQAFSSDPFLAPGLELWRQWYRSVPSLVIPRPAV